MKDQTRWWKRWEYEIKKVKRVGDSLDAAHGVDVGAKLIAWFEGDGDTVDVAKVFRRASGFFKQHPELTVADAAWRTRVDEDGRKFFALELEVVPPMFYPADL